jgi:hypothetical protein
VPIVDLWILTGLVAIACGVYAAVPQLQASFKCPQTLGSLSPRFTGALLVNNLLWLVVDFHLQLQVFVLGGLISTAIVGWLFVRQILWRWNNL